MNIYQESKKLLSKPDNFSNYFDECITNHNEVKKIWQSLNDLNSTVVTNALFLSLNAHKGQLRKGTDSRESRERTTPYIYHPLRIANDCLSYGLPNEYIAAALLHDTLEDTFLGIPSKEYGYQVIAYTCGLKTCNAVKSLTSPEKGNRKERHLKMYINLSKANTYTQTVKALDRLDNLNEMLSSDEFKNSFIQTYLLETEELIQYLKKADTSIINQIKKIIEENKKESKEKNVDKPLKGTVSVITDNDKNKAVLLVKKHQLKKNVNEKQKSLLENNTFLGNSKYYYIELLNNDSYNKIINNYISHVRFFKDIKDKDFKLKILDNDSNIEFENKWLYCWLKNQGINVSKLFLTNNYNVKHKIKP